MGIECKGGQDVTDALARGDGQSIHLGEGSCTFQGVVWERFTRLEGEGRVVDGLGTDLFSLGGGLTGKRGMEVRHLTLRRAGADVQEEAVGLRPVTGRFVAEGLTLQGWTKGVYLHGDEGAGTNLNGWRVYDLLIQNSGLAAFEVRGNNASSGTAVGLSIHTSCKWAPSWTATDCAGLWEHSMYGNSYNGLISSTNGFIDPTTREWVPQRPYVVQGSQNASVLILSYRERGQLPSIADARVTVVGGFSPEWENYGAVPGNKLEGIYQRAAIFTGRGTSATELRLGAAARADSWTDYCATAIDKSRCLSLRPMAVPGLAPPTQAYCQQIAGQGWVECVTQDGRVLRPTPKAP
jgi:hypothetical protein